MQTYRIRYETAHESADTEVQAKNPQAALQAAMADDFALADDDLWWEYFESDRTIETISIYEQDSIEEFEELAAWADPAFVLRLSAPELKTENEQLKKINTKLVEAVEAMRLSLDLTKLKKIAKQTGYSVDMYLASCQTADATLIEAKEQIAEI